MRRNGSEEDAHRKLLMALSGLRVAGSRQSALTRTRLPQALPGEPAGGPVRRVTHDPGGEEEHLAYQRRNRGPSANVLRGDRPLGGERYDRLNP